MYRYTTTSSIYQFRDLRDLMAKASPLRSGDQLAGIAAETFEERIAAQFCLADLPLSTFLTETLIPYETDNVTRLIIDHHDLKAFQSISSMTVGSFRDWLLSDEATQDQIRSIQQGLTPEMISAVAKIMRNQDLINAAAKCVTVTQFRNTIGLPDRFSSRIQPNHPNDDLKGILASTLDGLLYGCGDAVIGVNPATDHLHTAESIWRMLDQLINTFEIPTQACVLSHISSTLQLMEKGVPVDLVFQSIAGTQKANDSFGISLSMLKEAREAALGLDRGIVGNHCMYFETGQGSCLSANAHHQVDQQTLEARAYAVAREYAPLLVNSVVGFIGPEYLANGKQILRAALEDNFCGKLMGLPMGLDLCFTNHADADFDDLDNMMLLCAMAGTSFMMGVPGSDDIMLHYQSTSYHDIVFIRKMLHKKPSPEFAAWLMKQGLMDPDGQLLPSSPTHPLISFARK